MHQHQLQAPVCLPTRTVPRERLERVAGQRNLYLRRWIEDRSALAAERQESRRLRELVVSLGGDPGERP